MNRVKNKLALVTGGSRGIGEAASRLLRQEGANVIIVDLRLKEGKQVAKSIGADFFHFDVSDESSWQDLVKHIRNKHNHLDILFNNVGISGLNEKLGPQDPENITLKDWHYVHKTNLDGVLLGCKFGIALMKEKGGSIINMSSRSGKVGIPAACAYASSKAAVRNHTKSVALYCAEKGYNIRCNSLHPGAILTPMWEGMLGESETQRKRMIKKITSDIPLGVMGTPDDVAQAVLYLASDESKYLTGTELTIDGGILAGSSASPSK